MDALYFAATVVLVTISGALAPGPLFFTTISHGTKLGARGGLAFAIGHTLFEFPLIILLALGLDTIVRVPAVQAVTGVIGGAALIAFGIFQIRDCYASTPDKPKSHGIMFRHPILVGLGFTGLNPFFVAWWFTAGLELIRLSLLFIGFLGIVFMYVCHVWMDYVWLIAVAHFSRLGINVVDAKWYRIAVAIFGAILIYFGLTFLISVIELPI
ncbi:MAG: LysE family transporter [Candidatus Bathyarchaeota archaeon]|nr:MAG: LysE family transporter [Candidatus Bathyarchaeota archaeon]